MTTGSGFDGRRLSPGRGGLRHAQAVSEDGFTYVTRTPGPPLDRWVGSLWYARGRLRAPAERVAPLGSAVLGLVLGAPIVQTSRNGAGETHLARSGFLLGPSDEPLLNRPLGDTWCLGVVATPVGCAAAFGVPPASVRGRVVGAEAWPELPGVRRELRATEDPEALLDVVERALVRSTGRGAGRLPRCTGAVEAAVAALEADPGRRVGDVAREVGLSHAYLDRAFARLVGLNPGTFARVVRMRQLLASLDQDGPVAWGRVAVDHGWFDQPHLIRQFRRHTGVTPAAYLSAYRTVYGGAPTEPGFTPVVTLVDQVNPVQDVRGTPV